MTGLERQETGPPVAVRGQVGGVGWYPPAFFRALRKAGLDPAPGCADWDAWFDRYQATFVRLKEEGCQPYKIAIEPGDLARWLARQGREHAIAAHLDYVAWRLDAILAAQKSGGEP